MKASLEWLQEYSDIDVNCLELGDILTMTGSKVEEVIQKGNDIKNVVVGKILEIEKHPDAYLVEIAEAFNCSECAIRKALKKLNITRKKRQLHTKNNVRKK